MEHQDLIIIGAGPAGLSAGLYAGYFGLDAVVFEENIPGGLAAEIPTLENYPGIKNGITGGSIVKRMIEQCKQAGVEVRQFEKVIGLNLDNKKIVIETDKAQYAAENVIIASGRHPCTLGVPGEIELRGKGVSYCAVCDSSFFKDKKIAVIGEGSHAAKIALYLSEIASSLVLICIKPGISAEQIIIERMAEKNIEVLINTQVKEIKGDVKVKKVVLFNKKAGDSREIDVDGVFLQLEEIPNSQAAEKAGIKIDEKGYIVIDEKGRTNIDNIYAVGDVTDQPLKRVITAVAQAAVAVNDIFDKRGV